MNKCFRKINLKPNTKKNVLKVLHNVDLMVSNDDPVANTGDYWGICEHAAAEIITTFNLETHIDYHKKLNSSFFSIVDRYPKFLNFLDTFKLHYYFGKPITGNWGIHKHGYHLDTWTWTIFVENADTTTVGFHTPIMGAEKYGPITDSYYYDHLENSREVTTDHNIHINTGDMYTLDSWRWHSYTVPEAIKPKVYLLYFKLGKNLSIDDAIDYIEQLDFYE